MCVSRLSGILWHSEKNFQKSWESGNQIQVARLVLLATKQCHQVKEENTKLGGISLLARGCSTFFLLF